MEIHNLIGKEKMYTEVIEIYSKKKIICHATFISIYSFNCSILLLVIVVNFLIVFNKIYGRNESSIHHLALLTA